MEVPAWITDYISLWLVLFIVLILIVLGVMLKFDQRKQRINASAKAEREFREKMFKINLNLDSPES